MVQSLTESENIIALLKEEGLQSPLRQTLPTDFLDVTFNPATEKYLHLRKANHTPLYINIFSNHLPTIIKNLHKTINRRISDSSCNKEEPDKVESVCKTPLK